MSKTEDRVEKISGVGMPPDSPLIRELFLQERSGLLRSKDVRALTGRFLCVLCILSSFFGYYLAPWQLVLFGSNFLVVMVACLWSADMYRIQKKIQILEKWLVNRDMQGREGDFIFWRWESEFVGYSVFTRHLPTLEPVLWGMLGGVGSVFNGMRLVQLY